MVTTGSFARADTEVVLMNQVNAALRRNDRLNGAKAYTAAPAGSEEAAFKATDSTTGDSC
jgi:hypothetical protein